ncbi:MAG: hypothetical protein Q9M29_00660 [Mariprofundaceae bacterium]|nr:hypothetical protein [Mariprofundaceae bacterium]
MHLHIHGSPEEILLFELIGIQAGKEGDADGLFIGVHEALPEGIDGRLYMVLPDPETPLAETERLAEMLGRAVGQGKIQL